MRIIFIPQFPAKLRYSEWWFTEFPKQFRERGFEVLTLGEKYVELIQHRRSTLDMFSPINQAIEFETEQIKEYMMLDIQDDDILFLADISFPGFFANTLYHKQCSKMYAFCHATSLNKYDYFTSVSYSKFQVESSHAYLFDSIFVGSKYHEEKLQIVNHVSWGNTKVTYLPFSPISLFPEPPLKKTIDIMSASRPSVQKVDTLLENFIEKELGIEIQRPISNSWGEYFRNLQKSKVLLITAFEDTFGYQIVDAVTNNCIPLARTSFAYPELLERDYLYANKHELVTKLEFLLALEEQPQIPRLICEEHMKRFYDVICSEMKGEKEYPF